MSPMMNDQCMVYVEHYNFRGECSFEHKYQNPYGKEKTTWYTVSWDKLTQTNPDSGTERPIRSVAFKTLRGGAQEGGDSPEGVYQEGGAKSSGGQSSFQ